MAGRRDLPFVTADPPGAEDDLCYLLLGGAVPRTIEGLQHAARSRPLLTGQARVGRNDPVMQGREQAQDGFDPIKAGDVERHDGCQRRIDRCRAGLQDLDALGVAEVAEDVGTVVIDMGCDIHGERRNVSRRYQNYRGRRQDNAARIFLRQPEDRSIRRGLERVQGEIEAPTAAESCPSVIEDRRRHAPAPRNPGRMHRSDEATPRRYWRLSDPRYDRSLPRIAIGMRLASRRPPMRF